MDDFKQPGKITSSTDRMMATLSMNDDKEFDDSEQTRNDRSEFFKKILKLLEPWSEQMKSEYPRHEISIAILKSTASQNSAQKIHLDFDPKMKSDSFSTIFPLNDYCVVNMMSTGCQPMPLHVNKGFMLEFMANQPHGGGTNSCNNDQYRVHAYFYTSNSLPRNKVFYVV